MTITSDLRGFALACDKQTKKTLLLAADRIDAEIEKLRRELELDMFRGAGEIESYKREASVATRKLAQAEAENDRLVVKLNAEHIHRQNVEAENAKLRELVRCLVYAEHPSDRATLVANAADMLAELGAGVES